MDYNKKRHIQLLKRFQDLKNQGENLFRENPEEYLELSSYDVALEEQAFWTHQEEFFLVAESFLDNSINFDEFQTAFTLLARKTSEEVDMFKIDLEYIDKFQPSTRSYRFATVITSIYRQFEEIEDEYCTEQEVKDCVKKAYLKFQKFEE